MSSTTCRLGRLIPMMRTTRQNAFCDIGLTNMQDDSSPRFPELSNECGTVMCAMCCGVLCRDSLLQNSREPHWQWTCLIVGHIGLLTVLQQSLFGNFSWRLERLSKIVL